MTDHCMTDFCIWRTICLVPVRCISSTGELGYDGLNGTKKIGPSYAKSAVYIWWILDMHRTGTKHIVRHMQKSVVQWSVISKFTCIRHMYMTDFAYDGPIFLVPLSLSYPSSPVYWLSGLVNGEFNVQVLLNPLITYCIVQSWSYFILLHWGKPLNGKYCQRYCWDSILLRKN